MATAWRHSRQPTSPRRAARPPIANTRTPNAMRSSASSTGMYAGPGRWSEPSGNARLSQRATRPMRTSVAPAARSVVMARSRSRPRALLGALHLADLLHHEGQALGVLGPPRVELVRVHVG